MAAATGIAESAARSGTPPDGAPLPVLSVRGVTLQYKTPQHFVTAPIA